MDDCGTDDCIGNRGRIFSRDEKIHLISDLLADGRSRIGFSLQGRCFLVLLTENLGKGGGLIAQNGCAKTRVRAICFFSALFRLTHSVLQRIPTLIQVIVMLAKNAMVVGLVFVAAWSWRFGSVDRTLLTFSDSQPKTSLNGTLDLTDDVRETPLSFDALKRVHLPQPSSDLALQARGEASFVLPPDTFPDPSLCLHLLKLLGWDGTIVIVKAGEREQVLLRDLIFNGELAKKYLGDASFTPTRYGLRFPTKEGAVGHAADESHRDQCLAMLAQLGTELSQPLVLDGKTYSLRDVLRDSLANFHLDQQELAWTTVAYTSYLPPRTRWKNRYGMEFSFDDLATAMMDRPLDQLSCGGTHVYYALTLLLRADRMTPVLTEETRQRLNAYIQNAVNVACRNQKADGTWELDWWRDRPTQDSHLTPVSHRVLITGHMAEWLMYLPEDALPSDYEIRRAGTWLSAHLANATEQNFWEEVCPYTHMIFVVQTTQSQ